MEELLLIKCTKKELFRGTIFRFKGQYPFTEPTVDFMICEAPDLGDEYAPFVLYCVSGYCAGHREFVFPKEAMAENAIAIKTSWVIENWNKWIYSGCDVKDVKVVM